MDRRLLIKHLQKHGFKLVRYGGKHDVYSNGKQTEYVPRHKEINELLAKAIIRRTGEEL